MLLKQLGMLSKKLVQQAAMIGVQAGKKFEFKLIEGMVKAPVQKKLKKSFLPHRVMRMMCCIANELVLLKISCIVSTIFVGRVCPLCSMLAM